MELVSKLLVVLIKFVLPAKTSFYSVTDLNLDIVDKTTILGMSHMSANVIIMHIIHVIG